MFNFALTTSLLLYPLEVFIFNLLITGPNFNFLAKPEAIELYLEDELAEIIPIRQPQLGDLKVAV